MQGQCNGLLINRIANVGSLRATLSPVRVERIRAEGTVRLRALLHRRSNLYLCIVVQSANEEVISLSVIYPAALAHTIVF